MSFLYSPNIARLTKSFWDQQNQPVFSDAFQERRIKNIHPVNCQFIIGGSGFFIWEKNLSELVRRVPADLLGFPEIP